MKPQQDKMALTLGKKKKKEHTHQVKARRQNYFFIVWMGNCDIDK